MCSNVASLRRALGVLSLLLGYALCATASAEPVNARYIRIELPGEERALSLAEVEVYGPNAKTSLQGRASQSSSIRGADADHAVDANISGNYFSRSVTHTATEQNPWWQLDLGRQQKLARLVVRNRTDCCSERLNPALISAYDENYERVWSARVSTTQPVYEFHLETGQARPPGVNLLRNSAFTQQTNAPLPDYWDLFHSAALQLPDLHSRFAVRNDADSPVPGTRVLAVTNARADFNFLHVIPTRSRARLAPGKYTLSVFVKADGGGLLRVYRSWSDKTPATRELTSSWQRLSFEIARAEGDTDSLQPLLNFRRKGTYHLAAPKLEFGATATDYQAAPADITTYSMAARVSAAVESLAADAAAQPLIDWRAQPLKVDGAPFFIIGMAVGPWGVPPAWYFRDLRERGINTVFYLGAKAGHDPAEARSFVAAANAVGLKTVIGIALAGRKPNDWRARIDAYTRLMAELDDEKSVIGWYPLDEPDRQSWSQAEIEHVYATVKRQDPSRFVMVNWAYDAIPADIDAAPSAMRDGTDILSVDYYPFTIHGLSLQGFDVDITRAMQIARRNQRPGHSWIQLYGSNDAWREPTGDELSHMVYRSLLHCGMYSYWDTKSNSAATWQRVREINQEARVLAERLFLNPKARQIVEPTSSEGVSYAVWRTDRETYVLVLSDAPHDSRLRLRLPAALHLPSRGESLFENRELSIAAGAIEDDLGPLQGKVYRFANP